MGSEVTTLVRMKGEEFVERILAGERDFSRIELERGYDLSQNIPKLNAYLVRQKDLEENPIDISGSSFRGLIAPHVYLPYTRGRKVDLSGAYLLYAWFKRADLGEANLSGAMCSGAIFTEANLSGANLEGANLSKANLRGANCTGAKFYTTNLTEADLRGAILRKTTNLGSANFYATKVTKEERRIITNEWEKTALFLKE